MSMPRKKTQEEAIADFRKIHGDLYDYSKVEYIHAKSKIKIICGEHGEFIQISDNHRMGKGCPYCAGSLLKTQESIITDFRKSHGELYDYSKVKYYGAHKKVIITCHKHGEFKQTPASHRNGGGCPNCKFAKLSDVYLKSQEEIILNFREIHGNLYDYSKVKYYGTNKNVIIICRKHGEFKQTPCHHLRGRGCQICGGSSLSTIEEFILKCRKYHGNRYDYSKVDYFNARNKIKIICPKHGEFEQTPNSHQSGHGCSKCVGSISKKETLWLDSLNVPERQFKVKGIRTKPDGYDPVTHTIYEFLGDFWHGHPYRYDPDEMNVVSKKTFGQLHQETMDKLQKYRDLGYNVVYIWESDWDAQQREMKLAA